MQPTVVALSVGIILGSLVMAPDTAPGAATPAPLVFEAKISLGNIQGRIDHLAIDTARQRLYVSELGNNSIGVVDLITNRLVQTIEGFSEPQGIDYESSTDTVYVANGGDGSVRLLRGADLQPVGRIRLGNDADNVRINSVDHRVVVGYGDGALALIDPQTRKVVADIPLKGHPESFRFDGEGHRAYVNVPDAHEIAVVDLLAQKQSASWQTERIPLELSDEPGQHTPDIVGRISCPTQTRGVQLEDGNANRAAGQLRRLRRLVCGHSARSALCQLWRRRHRRMGQTRRVLRQRGQHHDRRRSSHFRVCTGARPALSRGSSNTIRTSGALGIPGTSTELMFMAMMGVRIVPCVGGA